MSKSVAEYLQSFTGKPFLAQFVLTISVADGSAPVLQILSYLIPASDENAAREFAEKMVPSLSYRYRNKNGDVVDMACIGVHDLELLDYVDDDGTIELSSFIFSKQTTAQDLLVAHGTRNDIPKIDQ